MIEIFKKYVGQLLEQGHSRMNLTFTFNLFTEYLNHSGLAWEYFGIKEAQELQSTIMAVVDQTGNRRYSPVTVIKLMRTIKGFYTWAKKQNLVHQNPFSRIKGIKVNKKLPKDIYEIDEIDSLLKWLSCFNEEEDVNKKRERYITHLVAELMYSSGITMGMVKKLHPADLDLERKTVKIYLAQLKKYREAFLSQYTADIFAIYLTDLRAMILHSSNYRNTRHLLFGTSTGLIKMMNKVLLEGSNALGLKSCTSKMFRHCLCLHLITSGCDARYTQELVGHEKLLSTALYIKLDKRDLRGVLDQYHPRGRTHR